MPARQLSNRTHLRVLLGLDVGLDAGRWRPGHTALVDRVLADLGQKKGEGEKGYFYPNTTNSNAKRLTRTIATRKTTAQLRIRVVLNVLFFYLYSISFNSSVLLLSDCVNG